MPQELLIENGGQKTILREINNPILYILLLHSYNMALYLKYRPKTFDDIVKQDHVVNILRPKAMSNDSSHSNYLFYGPRGTGKTSTARIFAKALNCTNLQNGNPCNQCDSCMIINTSKTLDVVEIDAASHTQVDNIREEIIDKARYPPAQLKKKVYIIDEVHMLSKSAFNALLKIMEEPPAYLVFILATTEIHKVPETIISRCQVFTLKKIPVVDLVDLLKMICGKESFIHTDEALTSIAKIADGCARDAVKYLDQVSILGDITQDHVTSFLWVASDQLIESFLQNIIAKNTQECFSIIDSLHETWVDTSNFIKQCLVYIEEHFSQDVSWYIWCADILKRITMGLRWFPLPTILMKMEIYNAFNTTQIAASEIKKPATNTEVKPASISSSASAPIWETPTPVPTKIEKTPLQAATPQPSAASNDNLVTQIAANPDIKPNIKSILEKSCIIEHSEESSTLYVFNKLQGSILQKAENRGSIEKAFKQITWANHWLQIVTTTREEFLAMKL
jgi:DNA polymerase III subunit gamma/tau